MNKEKLLIGRGLCKTFGPTKAVDRVDIDISRGEIRGLIGENGSGKSTLMSVVTGTHSLDSGEILFNGGQYVPVDLLSANRAGISIIMQEMNTIEGLTVSENIFLGHEKKYLVFGFKNMGLMNTAARKLLTGYGLDGIDPTLDVGLFSFEERKMIELVKAVSFNPQLFIVDETTTALSQDGRLKLYGIMKRLRDEGKSVVFISHDLPEVLEWCDTITVLRDGRFIDTVDKNDVTEDDLKRLMVGRELGEKYYREDYEELQETEKVLDVRGINIPGILEDVSLELHRGEILGVGGLTDCGMHELGKVIFGAEKEHGGSVVLSGKNLEISGIKQAIDNGIGYVSKNRDQEALMLYSSIRDNICLVCLDDLKKGIHISNRKETGFSDEFSSRLQVKMTSVEQFISDLSGGNKQKVSIAKWVAKGSDILVLDCPTRGIDVKVKAAIYELMSELKRQGKSMIMISEELLELIGMCDRIVILKHGRIAGEVKRKKDMSEEELIHYMI